MDWHGVRVVFRVTVAEPDRAPGQRRRRGSTAAPAWFRPARALRLPLTDIAREHVALLMSARHRRPALELARRHLMRAADDAGHRRVGEWTG